MPQNINDLAGAPRRRRDGFDFLAFHFFLDHGESAHAILVGVALRLKASDDIISISSCQAPAARRGA